jgi:hypothetical protein
VIDDIGLSYVGDKSHVIVMIMIMSCIGRPYGHPYDQDEWCAGASSEEFFSLCDKPMTRLGLSHATLTGVSFGWSP